MDCRSPSRAFAPLSHFSFFLLYSRCPDLTCDGCGGCESACTSSTAVSPLLSVSLSLSLFMFSLPFSFPPNPFFRVTTTLSFSHLLPFSTLFPFPPLSPSFSSYFSSIVFPFLLLSSRSLGSGSERGMWRCLTSPTPLFSLRCEVSETAFLCLVSRPTCFSFVRLARW